MTKAEEEWKRVEDERDALQRRVEAAITALKEWEHGDACTPIECLCGIETALAALRGEGAE